MCGRWTRWYMGREGVWVREELCEREEDHTQVIMLTE